MDWRAANEQQQEARWRVFLMFVVMVLLIIRTGLVRRGAVAIVPREKAQRDAAPATDAPLSTPPANLYQAMLVLLCLAEAAGRLFILKAREVWELMNQPLPHLAREQILNAVSLCDRPTRRLDTS